MEVLMQRRRLYFLDRNIVALIKRHNSGKHISDAKKIAKLDFLRSIDTPSSLVTPILSMIEGQKGRQETYAEKMDIVQKETAAVATFFRRANTDHSIMQDLATEFATAFSESYEENRHDMENFLREACPHVADNVAKGKREGVMAELLSCAERHRLPPSHLAVVLCLACLHGSEAARAVIKPGRIDENIHNVASDIFILPNMNLVRALTARNGIHGIEVTFVTCDEGLEKVLDNTQIIHAEFNLRDNLLQQRIRYGKPLFPGLTRAEYLQLMERLHHATTADGTSTPAA